MALSFSRELGKTLDIQMTSYVTIGMANCGFVNNITHSVGALIIDGLSAFYGVTAATAAITSTATAAAFGYMELKNVRMLNEFAELVLIDKSGDCQFRLSNVIREVDNEKGVSGQLSYHATSS